MSKFILAVHAGHNASAVIGDASGIQFAIQEERLNGEKNFWGLPKLAVRACLEHVGASARDLVTVVYASQQVFCQYHSRDDVLAAYRRHESITGKLRQRVAMPLLVKLRKTHGHDTLRTYLSEAGLGRVPLEFADHHTCHAAAAYYGLRHSPADNYLILTCDGAGDGLCATVRVMGGGKSEIVGVTEWANSLGAIYSWVTYGMGFMPLEHEYKLMGMAPYATEKAAREIADIFFSYLDLDESTLTFKRKTLRRTNDVAQLLFNDLRGVRFDHICAGLQLFTEELLTRWAERAVTRTGVRRVLAAGGVFMNVKANKRIAELAGVDYFEAFPSCGDETLPFGAYYIEAAKAFGDAEVRPLSHFYLGDDLDSAATEKELRESGFAYSRPSSIADSVASLLADGVPVARCAGRMEFGARALGNRSILADPRNSDVVRVINQMVKKRDFWMPFAPMVMSERQHEYLKNEKNVKSPYMMMTFDTRENFREFIAAVHNADLTCRAQILNREQNPPMYDILEAFEAKTGRAIILNTSFNLHGFPIVRTGKDALDVLRNSGLEHLQLGPWLVSKSA
jgi:carbamoyltransferase